MSLAWREGVTYTYDGDGNRVEKANGRLFWYGAGTEILDESDLTGSITLEMVYFGGKRVAHRTSSNVIYYYEGDMLGSARTIVQAGQTTVCYDADFLPFGGERDIVNTCSQNYKFEGKKRDNETGNDDFGARFYRSNIGRWMSADWSSVPAPVPYANLTNPQTLNLYAMVSDNPETFNDLDGHGCGISTDGYANISCTGVFNTYTEHSTTGEGKPNTGDGQPLSNSQQAANQAANVQSDQNNRDQEESNCNCGTNHHFKTANQAATAALNAIFPTSEKRHVEYGGRVYRNSDGSYSYTKPVTQRDATTVDVDAGRTEGSRIPPGTTNAGDYHTHETVRGYVQDRFSTADAAGAVRLHQRTYIETPRGLIHEIDGRHVTSYLVAPQYTWPARGPIP